MEQEKLPHKLFKAMDTIRENEEKATKIVRNVIGYGKAQAHGRRCHR